MSSIILVLKGHTFRNFRIAVMPGNSLLAETTPFEKIRITSLSD